MNLLNKILVPIVCLLTILLVFIKMDDITENLANYVEEKQPENVNPISPYKKENQYLFVRNLDDFNVYSKGDIKNLYYTVVNNGWKEFQFLCPKEYENCIKDVKELSENQNLLTHINNFVHPYNGFSNMQTTISETGLIQINVTYFYNEDHINALNHKVEQIYNELINDQMDLREKIKTIHDYIINNSTYDVLRNNGEESSFQSYLAYGPLFEGYATCNGYTDAMALFLNKLNVPNFKIATTPEDPSKVGHVWNAVYIDNNWYHLDLTWDDPVSNDGQNYLLDTYFLVSTDQLMENDKGKEEAEPITEHQFKKEIYLEFKNN